MTRKYPDGHGRQQRGSARTGAPKLKAINKTRCDGCKVQLSPNRRWLIDRHAICDECRVRLFVDREPKLVASFPDLW